MKYNHVNGYYVAGNDYVAIAINDSNPEDAHYFTPHTEAVDGIDRGAFDRAIAWTSPRHLTRDHSIRGNPMKSINILRNLIASGNFHHATYRNSGTVWEGLWFFRKDATRSRGYMVVGCVLKTDPDIDAAHELVKGTGISFESDGSG